MAKKLKGTIVSVTGSGDLLTDISSDQLKGVPTDEQVTVTCEGHVTSGIFPSDHKEPEMTLLAMMNSEDVLQLCLVGASAAEFLGIKPGADVVVKW